MIVSFEDYIKEKYKPESEEEKISKEVKRVKTILETGKYHQPSFDEVWNSLEPTHPLSYYIDDYMVQQMYQISVSTLGKGPKVDKMRELLAPKGILPIGVGTNRAVFQSVMEPNIVFKISLDNVGRKDSPREKINQEYLKPFCTKIYEVTPCGTVAMVEGVYPIKTQADFQLYFDQIVQGILVPFIGGRYALDDIGFENFMNYGVRENFGPVLLDFPYLFLYDEDKMTCKNIMPDGSICGGSIDYEVGFMDFVCPNCGQRHTAREVGKPIYDLSNILKKPDSCLKVVSAKDTNNLLTESEKPDVKIISKDGRILVDSKRKNKNRRTSLRDIKTFNFQNLKNVPR